MTGSAFKAMDVVVACLSYEKGGGLEEGGLEIGPDGRPADDGIIFEVIWTALACSKLFFFEKKSVPGSR